VTRAAWLAAFALAYGLAFPFRAGEVRFDLGIALGWVALAPLARGLRGLGPRAAFGRAFGAGSAAFAIALWWIYVVVCVHGHAAPLVGVLATALLAVVLGAHLGAAGALASWLEPRAGGLALWVWPAVFVVQEKLRGVLLFGGFPWAELGHAAHADPPLRELAALGGVYGLSFLLALAGSLLARGRLRAALGLCAAAHAAGILLGLAARPDPAAQPLRVGIVQASIPQGEKWDPARAGAAFAAHLELSGSAAASGPLDLVIWPETAVPVLLEADPGARAALHELARRERLPLLVGGIGIEGGAHERDLRFFNSVFAVDADGAFVDRYDKSKLVPFGEYVPLRGMLGFLDALATGLATTDVTQGDGARLLRGIAPLRGERAAAPLICYEAIYPELVRRAVLGGARLLLNLTNDAWYGRSSAPEQFLAIAAMRAAEHGVPMARAANTGISAVIDARGTVLESTPLFERRTLVAELPAPRAGLALYTRLGDWVVWASGVLIFGIALGAGGRRLGSPSRAGRGEQAGGDPRSPGRDREAARARRGAAEAPLTSRASASD
jgi:apolipoprotein N-acyltransferase